MAAQELSMLIGELDKEDEQALLDTEVFHVRQSRRSKLQRGLWNLLRAAASSEWFFLLVIGALTGLVIFTMTLGIDLLFELRIYLTEVIENEAGSCVVWVLLSMVLVKLALETSRISPLATGSGIPEMRTAFRSHIKPDHKYLNHRVLVAKLLGLVLANGAGLPLGKEGPSVHLASAVANLVMTHVPFFRSIVADNNTRRIEMLMAACALGISTNFTSPIGGVLFGIEATTSGYFPIRNYWRSFFSSVIGSAIFALLIAAFNGEKVRPLVPTSFPDTPFAYQELLAYAILGVVCGLIGSAFVHEHRIVATFINGYMAKTRIGNKTIFTMIVTFITALLTFPGFIGKFMGIGAHAKFGALFSSKPLQCSEAWSERDPLVSTASYVIVFFVLTAWGISLKVLLLSFFSLSLRQEGKKKRKSGSKKKKKNKKHGWKRKPKP